MSSWQVKKINQFKNLGEVLREKREGMNLTLRQISKNTMISERYLQFLEEEDWHRLPGEAYIKNFLKKYALELNLDPIRVLNAYQKHNSMIFESSISSLQKTLPLPNKHFIILPKILKNGLITLIVLILAGYLIWQVNGVLSAPTLNINSPTKNLITKEKQIVISGNTEKGTEININNSKVVVNNGKFSQSIELQPGLNNIKIIASKRYGKTKVEYRQVIRE